MGKTKKTAELGYLKVRLPKRTSLSKNAKYWIDRQDDISHIMKVDGDTRIYITDIDFYIVDDCMKDILPWLDPINFHKPNSSIIIHFKSVTGHEPFGDDLLVSLGDNVTFIVKERRIKEFIDKKMMYKYIISLRDKSQNNTTQS